MHKLYFSIKICEVIEDIVFCVRKMHYDFSILFFIWYSVSSVNLLLNFLSYKKFGKKLRYIFSKITYDVLYNITKVDIKTQLIREKTEIINHVKG